MNLQSSNQENGLPIFYTGCGNISSSSPIDLQSCMREILPKLSPEDFVNMRNSLSIIFSTSKHNTVRRTLLPTPIDCMDHYRITDDKLLNTDNLMVNELYKDNKPQTSSIIMDTPKHTIRKARRLFHENVTHKVDLKFERPESFVSLNASSASPVAHNSKLEKESDQKKHLPNHSPGMKKSPNTSTEIPTSRKRKSFSPHPEEHHKQFRPQHPSLSVWDQLSSDIWGLYNRNKQTPDVYNKKMLLREKLYDVLSISFPCCGLYIVGSSMTGFGTKNSDMDMCLILTDAEVDQQTVARDLLICARYALMKSSFIHYVEFIPAKVPILRFRDTVSYIEVDLNLNNTTGIRNTHLLHSYSRMDERVAPLIILVKMWAKQNNINDAKHNTLSSYSLALMVIHYLQYSCLPPVVPCLQRLQPEKYHVQNNIRSLALNDKLPEFKSENNKSIGQLFMEFLNYFANKFDFANDVMSVRLGGIIPREVAMKVESPKNKLAHWKYICIEEPFDLTNTACSVFKDTSFYHIHNTFIRCWNMLSKRTRLQDVLNVNL